ncbi:indole-3-glycerol-phosphate synthase [Leptospira gomenensis]|uniref:Indole-3-glycerol phosphate synthase n=1 Tax=Leptospira gomenensis TaxID=2484974 RepID=A0A5F1Y9L4_9LEPT|nr:indole-3-glycerol-phosphate synthase [Leptospira gomenensis]TGK31806.1 indole-3-glycerol-phosphate synthase [Leptospira gomenensis]TGK34782.1 indole-3-glycerol-phosphate synthase [Leptospira gomenensis]TGK41567.1 indole-3-glycerol-phosphate synthase [Leptospira gomenensis]TGK61475.1 indole-3-glycerol-phosphate synthase [Leptospira gomenensis]
MSSAQLHRVLREIISTKQNEIKDIQDSDPAPYDGLGLRDSLRSRTFSIIAECKRKSPSAGQIRSDYDALSVAKVYEESGASAISVLTDRQYFGGSLEDLRAVSSNVKIPVLRKDFILDGIQIREARSNGAAAVLLIVRILTPDRIRDFIRTASSLGMDSLVEVHTVDEAKLALDCGAEIVGVNTRDLDTFQIHQDLVEEVAAILPKNIVRVGESGVRSRSDLDRFRKLVDAALIGTYFMEKQDIRKAWLDLF